MLTTTDILTPFDDIRSSEAPDARWVQPADKATDTPHQFVFFIKPEATAVQDGVNLDVILDIVLERFAHFNVTPGAVRVVNGPYLGAHAIMDQHYGVINSISKGGRAAISAGAEETLQQDFADQLAAGVPVLGGHEFIDANPDFSPLALSTLNDNIGTAKLAGGTYALSVKIAGAPNLILNPFHPYQLVPFTSQGRAIIVVEGRSATSWNELRTNLVGATDPSTAAEGSIRNVLLARQADTGMKDVSQGANGVHLSAGPLEGMVELRRFLADPEAGTQLALSDTAFGSRLIAAGLTEDQLETLAGNPDFEQDGKMESAFDLTEEMDAEEAASLLAGLLS